MVEILTAGRGFASVATGAPGAIAAGCWLTGRWRVRRQPIRPAQTQKIASEVPKTIAPPRRVID